MEHQIMSINYTELENGLPAICVCSDFIIPITSKSIVSSFIGFYNKDLKFKINNLSNSLIKFTINTENETILQLYYKNMFIGYISMDEMYSIFLKCYETLINLSKE